MFIMDNKYLYDAIIIYLEPPVGLRKPPIDFLVDIDELADDCRVRGVRLCGKLIRLLGKLP